MAETTLKIEGMSCQHCVMAVKKAIEAVPGVSKTDCRIGSATVQYDESKASVSALEQAVVKAGYKVVK